MSYMSRYGKRPMEYASKASHGYIIKDDIVCKFIDECQLPKKSTDVNIDEKLRHLIEPIARNPVKYIIAVDGGYNEVFVQKEFPSATLSFFQFGALIFSIEDLEGIAKKPFIDPEDMQKLKSIERQKLAIPTKNIIYKDAPDLVSSVRKTIYEFFMSKPDKDLFIETLKWFIFEEYHEPNNEWFIAQCPASVDASGHGIRIARSRLEKDYTCICPTCSKKVYLTDVFRLHEVIDNEQGAGGILGYLTTTLEHMLLIHIIRIILNTKAALLDETLFIKDGPLGFFGQTANMHKPMRNLTNYLIKNHNLYLSGMEKSGAFVEHAQEIEKKLKPGEFLLLDNDYIYKYIIPGKADPENPYARTSYYSAKLFFRSSDEKMYVITIPVHDEKVVLKPTKDKFHNINTILVNVEKLKCDMYDDALIPIALVNKLVSLSNHPSTVILEKFAKSGVKNK